MNLAVLSDVYRCIDIASGRIFPLSLAGLLAPRSPPADATNPPPSAPYSYPSRYFSEMRLLHREVDIVVVGIGRGGNTALGSILHPKVLPLTLIWCIY